MVSKECCRGMLPTNENSDNAFVATYQTITISVSFVFPKIN